MIQIVIVNASKVLTDQQLRRYVPVMQSFDNEILAPAWNLEPAEYMFDTWTSFKKQRPSGPSTPTTFGPSSSTTSRIQRVRWAGMMANGKAGQLYLAECSPVTAFVMALIGVSTSHMRRGRCAAIQTLIDK
jgi:hypothetical protein